MDGGVCLRIWAQTRPYNEAIFQLPLQVKKDIFH